MWGTMTPDVGPEGTAVTGRLGGGADSRVKLAVGFVFAAAAFRVGRPAGLMWLAAFVAGAGAAEGMSPRTLLRGLRPVLFVVGLASLLHIVSTPGTPLLHIGPLAATEEGMIRAGWFAGRVLLVMAGLQLVTATTTPAAMGDALAWWLTPAARLGLPVAEVALMLTVSLTFVPVLRGEFERIVRAQAARGAPFTASNPLRRARAVVPVLLPLFTALLRRADELSEAMEARGYRGGGDGRSIPLRPFTLWDGAVLLASAAMLTLIGWRYR